MTWKVVNKAWRAGSRVWRDTATGDFYLTAGEGRRAVGNPRVGLYKGFAPSMDEGWTRWLLEEFGFDFASPGNAALHASDLRSKFDVIVFPDQPAEQIANGFRKGAMPDEYVGGLGDKGAAALKAFLNDGGTVVFLNHSSAYASKLGVDVKSSMEGVSNREFYSPGSMLNVGLDTKHPLAYGLPASIAIWSEGSPAWEGAAGGGCEVSCCRGVGVRLAAGREAAGESRGVAGYAGGQGAGGDVRDAATISGAELSDV